MSVGLATLFVIIFLLPGFSFLFGVYSFGRADRDTTPKNRLMELAGVAATSLTFHGAALLVLRYWLYPIYDDPIVAGLVGLVTGTGGPSAEEAPGFVIGQSPVLLGYAACSAAIPLFAGYLTARLVDTGSLPGSLLHGWAAPITVGRTRPYVIAEIVTRISHDDRIIMYRGVLSTLRQDRNHKIDYVVLVGVSRLYMRLGRQAPMPDPPNRHMTVRAVQEPFTKRETVRTSRQASTRAAQGRRGTRTLPVSRFLIDGEDISNIYFETIPWQGD